MEQSPFPSTTFLLSEKFVRRSQRVLQVTLLAVGLDEVGMVFRTEQLFSAVTIQD